MVAAQQGKVKFVKSLVEHGADINAEDAVSFVLLTGGLRRQSFDGSIILNRTIGRRCCLPPKKAMRT